MGASVLGDEHPIEQLRERDLAAVPPTRNRVRIDMQPGRANVAFELLHTLVAAEGAALAITRPIALRNTIC